MLEYASLHLYEDAYKMEFNWEKWLPRKVYEYHDLNYREVNTPVSLQMGVLLPFISSLCGPKTKGHFLTRPSCINLFWINVAASGVGKSQSRERMISQPLAYMMENLSSKILKHLSTQEQVIYTLNGMLCKIFKNINYYK